MAKKSTSGFTMAAEVRKVLETNKKLTGPEVLKVLSEKFPKEKINKNSFGVAYSMARKKLGISRKVSRKKPGKRVGATAARPVGGVSKSAADRKPQSIAAVSAEIQMLHAAKQLLTACNGNAAAAVDALKKLASLQIG